MHFCCGFSGSSLKETGSYLKVAALVGLLKTHSQNGLNLVSAPGYAKQIGVEVECNRKLKGLVLIKIAGSHNETKVRKRLYCNHAMYATSTNVRNAMWYS